jgi:hypothetical protein
MSVSGALPMVIYMQLHATTYLPVLLNVYQDNHHDVIVGFKEGSLEVRYFLLNPASIQ